MNESLYYWLRERIVFDVLLVAAWELLKRYKVLMFQILVCAVILYFQWRALCWLARWVANWWAVRRSVHR